MGLGVKEASIIGNSIESSVGIQQTNKWLDSMIKNLKTLCPKVITMLQQRQTDVQKDNSLRP